MENEVKPPPSQFPSVSDFPGLSPMPNSPQYNNNKNQCYLHRGTYKVPQRYQWLFPTKLSYSSKVPTIFTPTLNVNFTPKREGGRLSLCLRVKPSLRVLYLLQKVHHSGQCSVQSSLHSGWREPQAL